MQYDTSTPVLVMGGAENGLAITRNLGKRGVSVRVSGKRGHLGMHSRYCAQALSLPDGGSAEDYWCELLLSDNKPLQGHILFACGDDAVEFLNKYRDQLETDYILDDFIPAIHEAMLDKQKTLEMARSVDVPTPDYWNIDSIEDVEAIREAVTFPVMVKPIHSHKFQKVFDRKLFIIKDSFDELLEKACLSLEHNLEIMVVQMIPGPDSLLCSYFTYIDAQGNHLYHLTKRIIRRYPTNRGGASYHVTEWIPETAELGKKFFTSIGFRGMGNIEFKRDTRDGKLKVIEVNSRFTAVQELLIKIGMPTDWIVYCHLTNQKVPKYATYKQFHHMWYPLRDFHSFRELHKRGKLTTWGWISSLLFRRQVLPVFKLTDPWPFITSTAELVMSNLRKMGS